MRGGENANQSQFDSSEPCTNEGMPTIDFRIISSAEQRETIAQDFHALVNATEGAVIAEIAVVDITPSPTSNPIDAELARMWDEDFGASADPNTPAEFATIRVKVTHNALGSLSHLTMHFAELLTIRDEKPPAEPLLRQVQDDAGRPRVPWHVDVRP
ncbi:hypothetical protein CRES_0847 [Corynebacterium resistens DSM 45100]|uniref:Uncharacterized protein n=2 Tax=Corynebacterium resistens TaxID=258224 RepID=F8E0G2_CORRG|nr:hypothetical protein CRES_0847 [Corynebacterium resistens DSM 45100]